MDRISKRISKKALWELFSHYGDVVDVFIPYRLYKANCRTVFAFVRFKRESDMLRVIRVWNNKVIDGHRIVVSKVLNGRKEWKRQFLLPKVQLTRNMNSHMIKYKERDHRLYRDVVTVVVGNVKNSIQEACSIPSVPEVSTSASFLGEVDDEDEHRHWYRGIEELPLMKVSSYDGRIAEPDNRNVNHGDLSGFGWALQIVEKDLLNLIGGGKVDRLELSPSCSCAIKKVFFPKMVLWGLTSM
ncbi:hypothetical protein PTKIN_Ptkin14bG0044800 [Pterospermum kingtungense]